MGRKDSSIIIARLLDSEGFTAHTAQQVMAYSRRITHPTVLSRAKRVSLAAKKKLRELSEGDKAVIGKFITQQMRIAFDVGLRIGLTAYAVETNKQVEDWPSGAEEAAVDGCREVIRQAGLHSPTLSERVLQPLAEEFSKHLLRIAAGTPEELLTELCRANHAVYRLVKEELAATPMPAKPEQAVVQFNSSLFEVPVAGQVYEIHDDRLIFRFQLRDAYTVTGRVRSRNGDSLPLDENAEYTMDVRELQRTDITPGHYLLFDLHKDTIRWSEQLQKSYLDEQKQLQQEELKRAEIRRALQDERMELPQAEVKAQVSQIIQDNQEEMNRELQQRRESGGLKRPFTAEEFCQQCYEIADRLLLLPGDEAKAELDKLKASDEPCHAAVVQRLHELRKKEESLSAYQVFTWAKTMSHSSARASARLMGSSFFAVVHPDAKQSLGWPVFRATATGYVATDWYLQDNGTLVQHTYPSVPAELGVMDADEEIATCLLSMASLRTSTHYVELLEMSNPELHRQVMKALTTPKTRPKVAFAEAAARIRKYLEPAALARDDKELGYNSPLQAAVRSAEHKLRQRTAATESGAEPGPENTNWSDDL